MLITAGLVVGADCRLAFKYYQSERGEMKTKPEGREGRGGEGVSEKVLS